MYVNIFLLITIVIIASYIIYIYIYIYIFVQAELFVTRLLRHEEDTCTDTYHETTAPTTDNELNTSLHYAAQKG